MALGRTLLRRLWLGLAAVVLTASPLLARTANADRVPVAGAPASMNAELRRILRDEPAPQSLFDARRQADRAADAVSRLLESEGYYKAEVEPWAEGVDAFTRGVRVTTGPLFIINSTAIDYITTPDEATQNALTGMLGDLSVGAPARAEPVLQTEDAMLQRLRNVGFPDAASDPVDALADGAQDTIDFTFKLKPGDRAAFGDINVSGIERTRLDFVESLKPWKPGDRYSAQRLDEFRARLSETGIFDAASARLADQGEPGVDGLVTRDVDVTLVEGKRHTIALGASASTSEGVGVEAEWVRRNLTGRGDSVTVGAQLATLQRSLETTYRLPNIGGRYGRNIRLGAKLEDFETDAFDQTGGSLSATLEEQLTRRLRGSLGVEAGYASILDSRARILQGTRRDLYYVSGSGTAEYIGVRDILDPTNGVRARLAVEPGVTYGDTTIGFTRFSGEASLYRDLWSDRLVGAVRGKIGSIIGPDGVPPDRLFFAGGGGSVRGYEYQSLSPRIGDTPLGGRSLIETSAELRWRAGERLGYVAFIDAGAAGSNVEPPVDDMRAGVGLGVRYYAGFGPLRADIAIPLDKREGDADFQIYISIGQAF
jgi:translocation and assembly module TamA